jgi:8-oxo-dGTP diphosphatase
MISCTFENGGEGKLRHTISTAIILDNKNNILLTRRSPKIREGGKWDLVGGFMERDETIEESVRREVMEETGYQLTKADLFTVIDNPFRKGSDWQNIGFVYVCRAGEKTGEADWESTEQKWFNLDNLPEKEEMAFDHLEIIHLYLKNRNFTPLKFLSYKQNGK